MTAFVFDHDLDGFFTRQIVVDHGRQHDLIAFGEESRCLRPDDQIFAADDVGRARADSRAIAHRPGFDFPRGQVVGNRKLHFDDAVFVGG